MSRIIFKPAAELTLEEFLESKNFTLTIEQHASTRLWSWRLEQPRSEDALLLYDKHCFSTREVALDDAWKRISKHWRVKILSPNYNSGRS